MNPRIGSRITTLCVLLAALSASAAPVGPRLARALDTAPADTPIAVWVFLRDKGGAGKAGVPEDVVSPRSLRRRAKVRAAHQLVDAHDLPVHAPYVDALAAHVTRVRQRSKWFNAVSVEATPEQIEALRRLDFVRRVDLVLRGGRRDVARIDGISDTSTEVVPEHGDRLDTPSVPYRYDYGKSLTQLELSNIPLLHALGYDGSGVVVGHFDNGHRLLSHEVFGRLDILASRDFVDRDDDTAPDPSDPPDYGAHGIATLSVLAGFKESKLIGPAFGAQFLLARTENDAIETPFEEDLWVAGIEWADSIGVDVTSTSLGYREFQDGFPSWTWEDMDGNTTVITRAADMAVARGIVVVTGVGNAGLCPAGCDSNTVYAPADGDSVISVGAVGDNGTRAGFSSFGPTADGRTKPDVLAHGSGTEIAMTGNNEHYGAGLGTSLSTPVVAGVVALLLQAHPWATPLEIRDALRLTASRAADVDRFEGWGLIDAYAAFRYLRDLRPRDTNPPTGLPAYIAPGPLAVTSTGGIRYKLDADAHVSLQIFDVRGRLVRQLVSAPQNADVHVLSWDGRSDHGAPLGSGVFFVRLHTRALLQPNRVSTSTKKLLRIE